MKRVIQVFALTILCQLILAKNPIISDKGANDPHIRIIDGKAYLSASHDRSIHDQGFTMNDWWLWSSDDLVNWNLEYTLKPEETYIGKTFSNCWATDIVKRNGKYYWYFSEANQQTGVMVGDSPSGPWNDPLGKPLLSSDLTPTHEYDIGIIEDENGEFYIVFGVWDYYIAKLNPDMISLAESPRKLEIINPRGPYNLDGKNKEKPTDDKPFMHFHKGQFYLSWGCFYAMSDNVYGPFDYKGSIIEQASFATGYDAPTWPTGFHQGRHGSFFEWKGQYYYAYCDISQTGNRYFRDTFISYIHYKKNGEMALIRVDGVGVGNYDANSKIEAEDFYDVSGIEKTENSKGGFSASVENSVNFLAYPNVSGLANKSSVMLVFSNIKKCTVEIRKDSPSGDLIAEGVCSSKVNELSLATELTDQENLYFVFKGDSFQKMSFDFFEFK